MLSVSKWCKTGKLGWRFIKILSRANNYNSCTKQGNLASRIPWIRLNSSSIIAHVFFAFELKCSIFLRRGSIVPQWDQIFLWIGSIISQRCSTFLWRGSIIPQWGSILLQRGSIILRRGSVKQVFLVWGLCTTKLRSICKRTDTYYASWNYDGIQQKFVVHTDLKAEKYSRNLSSDRLETKCESCER